MTKGGTGAWARLGRLEGGMASVGGGLCLLAMLFMTVVSVFGRYVLGADLVPGGYNIIERLLFPLLVFWGLPLAHRDGTFPGSGWHRTRCRRGRTPRARRWSSRWKPSSSASCCGTSPRSRGQGYTSGRQMQIGTTFWPLYPVLAMVPLSFGLMLIEMVRLVVDDVRHGTEVATERIVRIAQRAGRAHPYRNRLASGRHRCAFRGCGASSRLGEASVRFQRLRCFVSPKADGFFRDVRTRHAPHPLPIAFRVR